MSDLINWILAHQSDLVSVGSQILAAIGAAALLAAKLPRPASGKLDWMFKVLDLLAANFGNAKNKGA